MTTKVGKGLTSHVRKRGLSRIEANGRKEERTTLL